MKPRDLTALFLAAFAAKSAHAATFNWTNAAGGSWATPGNWNSAPTFLADDILDFTTLNITANATTMLDGARTAGELRFADATTASHDWIVNTGSEGPLTLATSTGTPVISVTNRTATINAVLAGTQGFSKTGTGTLALTGANTHTGITTASAGILNVSGDQSAASGGWNIRGIAVSTVNFQAGSTLVAASGKSIVLANESTADHTLNVAGAVTNGGTLDVRARSFLNLNSGANWTQNGNMNLQSQASFASVQMTVNTGGTFTYVGANTIKLAAASSTGNGSAALTINGGSFTTGKAFDNTVAGTGNGSANLNFSNGGTLKLSADIASLVVTGNSPFNVATGTGGGVIDTNGFSTTLALGITDISGQSGSLTKAGAGTLTLSGTNTYTGATTVAAGTLSVSATDQFSDTAALALTTGATLDLNYAGTVGSADVVGNLRVDGVTQQTGIWGRVGSIAALGATYESSLITGDGLLKNTNSSAECFWDGTGTAWAAAASWTYLATDPSVNPPAAPDLTKLAIFGANGLVSDQTVQLGGNQGSAGMTFTSPVAFNFTGGGTDSTLALGTAGITISATSGNVTFGSADIGQHVALALSGAQTWTNLSGSALTTVNGVALGADRLTTAGSGAINLGGAISGSGGLTKTGSHLLALTGTNSYTGITTVSAGTTAAGGIVNVSGDQSAANGGWIINGAATVNFQSGSTIVLGAGKTIDFNNGGGQNIRVLNVAGTVTTSTTSDFWIEGGNAVNLNSGAAWTQSSGLRLQPNSTFTNATMTVNTGASFTYAGSSPILLANSLGSNGGNSNLNLSGGTFITGRGFDNNSTGTAGSANLNFSNGGTLKLSADIASLATSTTSKPFNVTTGTGGGIIDTNGFSTTLALAISGTGSLTKTGPGTLTLSAANTYSGDTTVSAGTLAIEAVNASNETSTVTIAASEATLHLAYGGTDTVDKLFFGTTQQPDGDYSASGVPVGATIPADRFTGTGTLTVTSGPASGTTFSAWITGTFANGQIPEGQRGPNQDFDNDGISNLVEFAIDGEDPTVPKATVGSFNGTTLSFTKRSGTTGLTYDIESSTDLAGWIVLAKPPVVETAESISCTLTPGSPVKNFARLKVMVSGS